MRNQTPPRDNAAVDVFQAVSRAGRDRSNRRHTAAVSRRVPRGQRAGGPAAGRGDRAAAGRARSGPRRPGSDPANHRRAHRAAVLSGGVPLANRARARSEFAMVRMGGELRAVGFGGDRPGRVSARRRAAALARAERHLRQNGGGDVHLRRYGLVRPLRRRGPAGDQVAGRSRWWCWLRRRCGMRRSRPATCCASTAVPGWRTKKSTGRAATSTSWRRRRARPSKAWAGWTARSRS